MKTKLLTHIKYKKNKMNYFDYIYEPEEDSFILLDHSIKEIQKIFKTINIDKNNNQINICEVGVGSGYVLRNLAKKFTLNQIKYFGTDINPKAIEYTKKIARKENLKIDLNQKSLLEGLTKKSDIIIFNTPYLPCETGENYDDLSFKDKAIYGGKNGYEVIEKFIYQINDNLKDEGKVLMLFSSFSNLKYIQNILDLNFFKYKILEEKRVFHEKLYCMKITKTNKLKQINKTKITNIKYLTKGKHSVIFEGKLKQKKVIIKYGKQKDIQIEKLFLTKFQKYSFAPKLYSTNKNIDLDEIVVMEKLEGKTIKQFLEKESKKENIIKVLNKCLEITQELDKLKINKQELTNPYKHIFIDNKLNIKFIDFERCLHTIKPKNTTQFLDYIRKQTPLLKTKKLLINKNKIMQISKDYKLSQSKTNKLIQIKDLI